MLYEEYLDNEKTIWNYGTAPITGEDVVDVTKTGTSYYNDFLNPSGLKYLQTHKNLTGEIIKMTPREYFERCARDIFGTSVDHLIAGREADKRTNNLLDRVLNEYKLKLCLPMINYADKGQEGLHRMLAIARNYGWDKSVPVLVVDYFDKERAKQEQDKKFVLHLTNKLYDAVRNAIQYHYSNLDEFKEELEEWCLEKEFKYEDDVKKPVEVNIEEFEDYYIVRLKQFSAVMAEVPKYAVKLDADNIEDSLDFDDFNLDDLEESFSNEHLFHRTNNVDTRSSSQEFTLTKELSENYDADMKGLLITILDKYVHNYYESSKMACELICEELCYEHNLDADFQGRTIYINNDKIATLKAVKDGPDLVAITGYTLYI